jgi:hypothetical protein
MLLLSGLFAAAVAITFMAQRGFPAQVFQAIVGANVAGTPAGISNVIAIPQYAGRGVEQVRSSFQFQNGAPTLVQITVEGNDVDPTDAASWFVIATYNDLVNGMLPLTPANGIPRWMRHNIVGFAGVGVTVNSQIAVN